jgi:hypothetical protein
MKRVLELHVELTKLERPVPLPTARQCSVPWRVESHIYSRARGRPAPTSRANGPMPTPLCATPFKLFDEGEYLLGREIEA